MKKRSRLAIAKQRDVAERGEMSKRYVLFPKLGAYLAQKEIHDLENHVERELRSEERQEPLAGKHMAFHRQLLEVVV